MKHLTLRRILLSAIALSMLPFSAACSGDSEESSRRSPAPKFILTGTQDVNVEHDYLDFYTITSSEVEDTSGYYAVALKTGAVCPSTISIPARYPENSSTGKPVVGIMPYGFRFATATSIEFKKDSFEDKDYQLKVIDYEAFLGSSIQSIDIPWSIKKIGDSAFYDCRSLGTARFNSTNKSSTGSSIQCPTCTGSSCSTDTGTSVADAKKCTLTNIPAFCFFRCTSLASLTLSASIEEIEYEAFNGCSALSSVLYFQKISIIRARAFQGCTSLGGIYIPASFFANATGPGIEALAFNNCSKNLQVVFCISETDSKYTSWRSNHPDWGWYNETGGTKLKLKPEFQNAEFLFDTDWQYKVSTDGNGVTITKYIGATPTNGFVVMPDTLGGETVRYVERNAFVDVRTSIQRLYLPTTLYTIDNQMFGKSGDNSGTDNLPNLYVIDSRDHCSLDWDSVNNTSKSNIDGRIDLSHLVDLQFIGDWAFCQMTKKNDIKSIHLPANLIAVGSEAFCRFADKGHMESVTEFLWDFDEDTSRLQVIGTDSFYKLGVKGYLYDGYGNSSYNSAIKPTTIVFPRTFKYFGMREADANEYKNPRSEDETTFPESGYPKHVAFSFNWKKANKWQRPAHCFANCPLIGTVVFKGSLDKTKTTDLIIPNQTFICNENLQTIVFEERKDHFISFHTQAGRYSQRCIGQNGVTEPIFDSSHNNITGYVQADYRGRPFLQTIVLPTKNTKLRIQKLAFQGNPRAAIYLSGPYGPQLVSGKAGSYGMYYDDKDDKTPAWTSLNFNDNINLENATQWRTIGDDSFYEATEANRKVYLGYCFAQKANVQETSERRNQFYLDQKTPCYPNVHYEKDFTVKAYVVKDGVGNDQEKTIHVEVGESGANSLEYVERDNCSYLCGGTDTVGNVTVNKAIMTNYLYRLWPNGDDSDRDHNRDIRTAVVKKTIKVPSDEEIEGEENPPAQTSYTVTEIGDSAFSAAHCNEAMLDDRTQQNNQGSTNDLEHVKIPNTIKKIGEYAFMRAYGVRKISAYDTDPASAVEYTMPTYLEYVGRNAFSFCNVEKFLNFPDDCIFYENDNKIVEANENGEDYKSTSVFTNDFSLRKVTFKHDNTSDSAESNNYVTSTYKAGNDTFTTAIYSKATEDNPKRLLVILNRPVGTNTVGTEPDVTNISYFDTPSNSNSPIQDFLQENSATYPTFKVPGAASPGATDYSAKPFLYGAYKMAYWLKSASIGYCTTTTGEVTSDRNKILKQPLFSGICKRTAPATEGGEMVDVNDKDSKLYLGYPAPQYDASGDNNIVSDLVEAGGEMFDMPLYGFNGCENLSKIKLPNATGGKTVLPDGLFAECEKNNYSTTGGGSTTGHLNLTGTGYTGIGEETFLNNKAITNIVAPSVAEGSTFTIGARAFKNCTNLTTLDLSAIEGSVIINASAFENCSKLATLNLSGIKGSIYLDANCFKKTAISSITWPSNANATVYIGTSAFEEDKSLTSLTLPAKTTSLSAYCFKNCTELTTVAFAGNNTDITAIEESAFNNCGKLGSFDFGHLTELTTIGNYAFYKSGLLGTDGKVTFGSKVASFGTSSFEESKIKEATFNASSLSIGASAFKNSKLEKVTFSNDSIVVGANGFTKTKLTELTFSCSSIELGASAFSEITTLTKVRFTDPDCAWNGTAGNIFADCGTALTDLQLPTGFSLTPEGSSYMILNDTNVRIFTYHIYNDEQSAYTPWRVFNSVTGNFKDVIYYAETPSDLNKAATLSTGKVTAPTIQFWTLDSGEAKYLGTLLYATSTLAIFSEGFAMDANGDVSPAVEISQFSDVVENGSIKSTVASKVCWMNVGGTIIPLGTPTSVSADGNVITFSIGFFVKASEYGDVVDSDNDVLIYSDLSGTHYYFLSDGTYLGTIIDYDDGTGVVTFSSGYTLDSNGFHAPSQS